MLRIIIWWLEAIFLMTWIFKFYVADQEFDFAVPDLISLNSSKNLIPVEQDIIIGRIRKELVSTVLDGVWE